MQTPIDATPTEAFTLAEAINEDNATQAAAKQTAKWATRCFTLFCEAHGIPGATFVGIADGTVIVEVPEQKPELVKETA